MTNQGAGYDLQTALNHVVSDRHVIQMGKKTTGAAAALCWYGSAAQVHSHFITCS
jgi:uncharacterized protein YfaA (DUF2138 family)